MAATFFASANAYSKTWKEIRTWKFGSEDLAFIESAVVVPGIYGPAVMCNRKDGLATFINIDTRSVYQINQAVDLSQAIMVDYTDGARTIQKILIGVAM
jgi:hypothetical protein